MLELAPPAPIAASKEGLLYIETPRTHRYPGYVRLIFALQYGLEFESARLQGRSPNVFLALSLLYGMLDRKSSPLDPALRSLITLRVSPGQLVRVLRRHQLGEGLEARCESRTT